MSRTAGRNRTEYDSQIFLENIIYTLLRNPTLLSEKAVYFSRQDIKLGGKTNREAVFIDINISLTHRL